VTIKFVEFTYCKDIFSSKKIRDKEAKYKLVIEDFKKQGWTIGAIIVIIARARGAIYQITKIQLKQNFLKFKTSAEQWLGWGVQKDYSISNFSPPSYVAFLNWAFRLML
jgi:hypothetical protein